MPAQFVLKKGPTGKFRFTLVARSGQVVATSEAYETRAKAMAGIESVRKNAADAVLVDGTAPAAKPATRATTARKGAGTTATVRAAKAMPTVTPADARGSGGTGNGAAAKAAKAVARTARKVTSGR